MIGLWRAGIRKSAPWDQPWGGKHIKQLSRLTERVVLAFRRRQRPGISRPGEGAGFLRDYTSTAG